MNPEISKPITLLAGNCITPRAEAAQKLLELGSDAREAAVALACAAGDSDAEVRETAVAALEGLWPPPPELLPELVGLLEDDRADTAYWAATLLGRLGRAAVAAVSPLTTAAAEKSHNLAVRERCVWALGRIGPPASRAVPLLETLAAAADSPRISRLASESIELICR